jgi:RHS repeat-associated protein
MLSRRKKRSLSLSLLTIYGLQLLNSCAPAALAPQEEGAARRRASRLSESNPLLLPADTLLSTETTGGYASGLVTGRLSVTPDGAATYSLPLWVPPGRAGMQPELSLVYNSRGGNGLLGVGWSLTGLSRITRCSPTQAQDRRTAPIRFDASDPLCLDGNRLVLMAGAHGAAGAEYRTEVDQFTRVTITSASASGPSQFEARLRDGRTLRYGSTDGSVLEGPRLQLTPAPPTGVSVSYGATVQYAWALSEVRDALGNFMRVRYSLMRDPFDGHAVEQVPIIIDYTGSYADTQYLNPRRRVELHYDTSRPDKESRFVSGLKLKAAQRLTRIELWAPATLGSAPAARMRSYVLTYRNDSLSQRSLLSSIQECDGQEVCRRPLEFEWERGRHDQLPGGLYEHIDTGITDVAANGWVPDPHSPGGFNTTATDFWTILPLDINGDGRDDLLYRHSGVSGSTVLPPEWRFRLSSGVGFAPPVRATSLPKALVGDALDELLTVDMDMDGRTDVIGLHRTRSGSPEDGHYQLYRSTGSGFQAVWNPEDELYDRAYDTVEGVVPPAMHVADLDGDGLPDVLRAWKGNVSDPLSPTFWAFRLNTLGTTGGLTFTAPYTPMGLRTSADHVGFATDVDGDGASEVLLRKPELLPPSESHSPDGFAGYFTAMGVTAEGALREAETTLGALPWDYPYAPPHHARQQWFVDVNGDGLPDALSIVKEARVGGQLTERTLFLSINTGVGFLPPQEVHLPPGALPGPAQLNGGRYIDNGVRVFDFNFDGRQDLLLMDEFQDRGVSRSRLTVLESTGSGFIPRVLPIPAGWSTGAGGDGDPRSQPGSGFGYRLSRLMDVDGDGLMDIIQAQPTGAQNMLSLHIYRRQGSRPDLLTAVRDGNGNRAELAYNALTDFRRGALFYSPDDEPGACGYPLYCDARGIHAVASLKVPDGLGGTILYTYSYKGARRDLTGRGWLGFSYRSVENTRTRAKTETWFNNVQRVDSLYLLAGLPHREEFSIPVTPQSQQRLQRSTMRQWQPRTSTGGRTYSLCPLHEATTESDTTWGALRHVTTNRACDEYGNLTSEEVLVRRDGGSSAAHRFLRETRYDNWTTSWKLGVPRVVRETHATPPDARNPSGLSTTRTTRYDYCPQEPCPDSNLLYRITVEPDALSPAEDDLWLEVVLARLSTNQVHHVRVQDRQGRSRTLTVRYEDQERIFPSLVTNALGHQVEQVFHPGLGVLAVSEDANGVRTRWQYDGLGRLRVESAPYRTDGLAPPVQGATFLQYGEEQGRLALTVRTEGGGESVIVHDAFEREAARRTRGFDGSWSHVRTEYDALGRLSRQSLPYAEREDPVFQQFFHDQLGRLTLATLPGASSRWVTYEGRTHRVRDGFSESQVVVDALGQVEERRELKVVGDGQSAIATRYTYAPFGLLDSVTDARGHVTVATHDRRGRRTSLRTPDTGWTQTSYDGFGQVREERDALGEVSAYAYDALGRLRTVTSKDGVTRMEWDSAPFGVGRLAASVNERDAADPADDIATGYGYDALGRPSWESLSLEGATYQVDVGYDGHGRLATVMYPAVGALPRFAVSYGYTLASGMLESVRHATSGHVYWQALEQNASWQPVREAFGNGVTSTRRYDALGRLRFIDTQGPGGAALQRLAYAHLPNGQLRMRYDALEQVREEFEYDALSRLTQWNVQTPCERTATGFSYDDLGNLTARTVTTGVAPSTTSQRFDYRYGEGGAGPHAVSWYAGESFGYDAKGNQTTWAAGDGRFRQVTYTAFELPRTLLGHGGLRLDFAYDAQQQRVLKQSASGERTVYVGGLYEKRLVAGHTSHVFHVRGGGPVAQVMWTESGGGVAESTAYLHGDSLGSLETVTGEGGQVLERRKYQPYGQRGEPSNPARAVAAGGGAYRQGFTGHEEDSEAGLLNMRGRLYEPRVGRFLTADPYVQAPFSGQAYNRYSYVFNNPLNLVDPSGFTAMEVCASSEGGPCQGASSSESPWSGVAEGLGKAWEAVRGATREVAEWHERETQRARAGASPPAPLPAGAPPTPTADLNGSRDTGGQVAAGAGLALTEIGLGLVKDVAQSVLSNPVAEVERAMEMAGVILEGAREGYAEDGVLGAVTGGINTVNPVYSLLTSQHMAREAARRGDNVSAGYHGIHTGVAVISILGIAAGGAGAARFGATRGVGKAAREATGFLGHKGFELKNLQVVRNHPATIKERSFSGHALDQMQNRGVMPSVVENAIKRGQSFATRPGTAGFFDSVNNVRVIVNSKTGQVVTVIRGAP